MVENATFRFLKAHTPGAYTFILPASREVPKRLQHPKRKSIGIRVPDNLITQMLLAELGAPLMSVTLILPGNDGSCVDIDEISEKLDDKVEVIIDGGFCGIEPTTVIDFMEQTPKVIRIGKGKVD